MKTSNVAKIIALFLTLMFSYTQAVKSSTAEDRVQRVCLSMQPFMDRSGNLKGIKIDQSKEINAYADSSGQITFLMGMLDFVNSDDEIAVVCGHEIAHLSAQHIKRSVLTSLIAGVAQEYGGDLGAVAGSALYTKQSRKHEREADRMGLLYMWQAGYDPRTAWRFWQRMEEHFNQGDAGLAKYFSTHPVNEERIENFKVLPVRECLDNPQMKYCNEILSDPELTSAYKSYEARQ